MRDLFMALVLDSGMSPLLLPAVAACPYNSLNARPLMPLSNPPCPISMHRGAGRAPLLCRLGPNGLVGFIPTHWGWYCEDLREKNKTDAFHLWDVGGQEKQKPLQKFYMRYTDGFGGVADSVDAKKMKEAKKDLWQMLSSSGVFKDNFINVRNVSERKSRFCQ